MHWATTIQHFTTYLKLGRSLSNNTVLAYTDDIKKLYQYLATYEPTVNPLAVTANHLQKFLIYLNSLGLASTSQARIVAAIRAFYQFLALHHVFEELPTQFLTSPIVGRKLPKVLSIPEIEALFHAIDHSTPWGMRNRAMLETLYSSGLRVSELVSLKINYIYFEEQFVRIIGKGDKERLVPIGQVALKYLRIYLQEIRSQQTIAAKYKNYVFLNKQGRPLSRIMVFRIIKELAHQIGLKTPISPHTFRHSFATHLIEGGADLRAIQTMLGHTSITTTEIYTHIDRSYLQQIIHDFHPRGVKKL
jgi:integrase/recombinase XerD